MVAGQEAIAGQEEERVTAIAAMIKETWWGQLERPRVLLSRHHLPSRSKRRMPRFRDKIRSKSMRVTPKAVKNENKVSDEFIVSLRSCRSRFVKVTTVFGRCELLPLRNPRPSLRSLHTLSPRQDPPLHSPSLRRYYEQGAPNRN